MKGNWFWESSFAIWLEGKLISLTNWFWNKRHPPKQVRIQPTLDDVVQEKPKTKPPRQPSTSRKAPAKKTTTKKDNWSVKK